jgi:mannose-6-phosphate isomerase
MQRLTNAVRDYDWGSTSAIPEILGIEPTGEPAAELWMGTHPGAPSRLASVDGRPGDGTLADLVASDPEGTLGNEIAERTGPRLPFLFKVLAAERALSIQAHPSPEQAAAGFRRENDEGVPLDAPNRNYKDDQAKPELVCALGPFEALCGFATTGRIQSRLSALREAGADGLDGLLDLVTGTADAGESQAAAIRWILQGDPERHAGTVAAAARAGAGSHDPSLALLARLDAQYPGDPGVLVSLLMNLVVLAEGEALYLPAGNLHAYVAGVGMELMNASDNVLRGGLTSKHIDVPELLAVLDTTPAEPAVLRPQGPAGGWQRYPADAATFELHRLDAPADGAVAVPAGPAILFVAAGSVTLAPAGWRLERGDSVFVSHADAPAQLEEVASATTVFAATSRGID